MNHFDLLIIGTGSGNSLLSEDFESQSVAIVERGVFGGTCLNVGCIPSKMFVYASEIAHLSLIHISEPTRLLSISYAVFC